MKKKNLLVKIFCRIFFRSSGVIWNSFGSLISLRETSISTHEEMQTVAKTLLDFLSPIGARSSLKRYGGSGDGSYVLPKNVISNSTFLISGGIAKNNEFEIELANIGLKGIQVDNSIDYPPKTHPNLEFQRATIGSKKGPNRITLNELISDLKKGSTILKLDIEGAEYSSLLAMDRELWPKVNAIVLELHNLENAAEQSRILSENNVIAMLRTLKNGGFYPVHLNANNCCGVVCIGGVIFPRNIEVTFVYKDFARKTLTVQSIKKIRSLNAESRNIPNLAAINIDHILAYNLINK